MKEEVTVPTIANRLYTVRDMSKILRCSEATVRKWAEAGRLHCFPFGRRMIRFSHDEVLRVTTRGLGV